MALPSQLRQIRKLLKDREIDIVQIRFPSPFHYVFRVLRLFGSPPYCISFHGSDVWLYHTRDPLSRLLVRWALSGASAITAVSRSLAGEAEKTFLKIGAISTIYNGKVIEDIDQASGMSPAVRVFRSPDKFFVNPANVTWHKGQTDLIRAWAKLPSDMNEVHLLIAGEQRVSWGECVDLIQELNCGDRVHLLGPLPQPELFSLMGRAMGCIMASRREGFSSSVLEAGALRLALICTDIPSFREIIRHGENGLLVPLDDLEAMVSAISELARDVALRRRLGDCLHHDVCTHFTAQRMATDYLALYDEVLKLESDARGD